MKHVLARTRPDRLAYTKPKGGAPIPRDAWVLIPLTPWIADLERDGDIETRAPDEPAPEPVPSKAKKPDAKP